MDQAEQLRIIKANKQIRPTARVITVTSGKGGVGKSNMSINLAIQFRKMGKRVVILDADFGLANIEIMFGAVPKHNLCDLVYEGKSISDIITQGPMGVGFISGGSGIAGMSNLGKDALTCIIQNLAELDALTDVIIVDTGAGISDSVLEFLVASGEVLLVTTPEPTSITDSYSLLKALYRHPRYEEAYTKVKMVANRVENVKNPLQRGPMGARCGAGAFWKNRPVRASRFRLGERAHDHGALPLRHGGRGRDVRRAGCGDCPLPYGGAGPTLP